jgi:serine/threonine protein kinase
MKNIKYLCKGIQILLNNDYVHQDIKLENIVFNGKNLYLIDFGLMVKKNDIYNHEDFLKYNYIPFPPEYQRYVYGADYIKYFMKTFNGNPEFLKSLKELYPNFQSDLNELKSGPSYPTDKIDIYSLGMVMCSLYRWYGKKNNNIEELICGMVCMNPVKRWNIEKVIRFLEHI